MDKLEALKALIDKAGTAKSSEDALRYAQAANLISSTFLPAK